MKKLLLILILLAVFTVSCNIQPEADDDLIYGKEEITDSFNDYEENILIAVTETQQEAEDIAAKCNIQLINWEYGVARFYTEENLDEVIVLAEKLNLAQLSRNHVFRTYY